MNARAIALLAQSQERWPLAGDQLFVDLDLSADNLPPGTRLAIGSAVIEVSALPHTGCQKFVARFGPDAAKFVNSVVGRQLHLRGLMPGWFTLARFGWATRLERFKYLLVEGENPASLPAGGTEGGRNPASHCFGWGKRRDAKSASLLRFCPHRQGRRPGFRPHPALSKGRGSDSLLPCAKPPVRGSRRAGRPQGGQSEGRVRAFHSWWCAQVRTICRWARVSGTPALVGHTLPQPDNLRQRLGPAPAPADR